MKLVLTILLLFTITTRAEVADSNTEPLAPGPQWLDEGKIYKLVCDPSNSAAFLKGLTGKHQCTYLEISTVEYIKKRDKPCDNSFTGQFLRGFLGRACETTKSLRFSETDYARYKRCDETFRTQFMAGLLSKDPCEYKFEAKTK